MLLPDSSKHRARGSAHRPPRIAFPNDSATGWRSARCRDHGRGADGRRLNERALSRLRGSYPAEEEHASGCSAIAPRGELWLHGSKPKEWSCCRRSSSVRVKGSSSRVLGRSRDVGSDRPVRSVGSRPIRGRQSCLNAAPVGIVYLQRVVAGRGQAVGLGVEGRRDSWLVALIKGSGWGWSSSVRALLHSGPRCSRSS